MSETKTETLEEKRKAVLMENMRLALESGLAGRYQKALDYADITKGYFASEYPSSELQLTANNSLKAQRAELPIAFSLDRDETSPNMYAYLQVVKVHPIDGKEIPGSAVKIGVFNGTTEGIVMPASVFTPEDFQLATNRLREQKLAGLVYGLPEGGDFLPDY